MRILSKLLIAGTLLSGGVASADNFRGGGDASVRDHRDTSSDTRGTDQRSDRGAQRSDRDDQRGNGDRDRNDAPAPVRIDHDHQRGSMVWVAGQWTRQGRRWVWSPGHYERVARGRF